MRHEGRHCGLGYGVLLLAEFPGDWAGEAVFALVGDEKTGGVWGTQYLLANFEETVGDAMISGDAPYARQRHIVSRPVM